MRNWLVVPLVSVAACSPAPESDTGRVDQQSPPEAVVEETVDANEPALIDRLEPAFKREQSRLEYAAAPKDDGKLAGRPIAPGVPGRSADVTTPESQALALAEHNIAAASPDAARYQPLSSTPAPIATLEPSYGERYTYTAPGGFLDVTQVPVSTFGLDVDTASYSNVRRFLTQGRLPPPAAVRVEELMNYFDYDYPAPPAGEVFTVHHELARAPWSTERHLLKIALQAKTEAEALRPTTNLVLLIDVSGSMADADKLPLLKESLKLMVRKLQADDRVGIVTYAGYAGVLLPSTSARHAEAIIQAIDQLEPGGSTAGASGIELAYQVAQQGFTPNGINRVLLATDGDFNVGISDVETLKSYVSERRASGIGLSTLGFGEGNYNDALMEALADHGNGSYGYVDSLAEGHKLLVEQLNGTLATVAGDAKLQVEFNPAVVKSYRLVGYENRGLRREDFTNDHIDAGDVGMGHNVTALYELELRAAPDAAMPLRYDRSHWDALAPRPSTLTEELAYVRLRYKRHGQTQSEERSWAVSSLALTSIEQSSEAFRFATAVAGFGERLRGNPGVGNWDWQALRALAASAQGQDRYGHRKAFLDLVDLATRLRPHPVAVHAPGLPYSGD